MGREERVAHAHADGNGDRTGRYVPLHELQEKYGDVYGVSEQVAILPKAILPRDNVMAKAPNAPPGDEKKRMRRKKGDSSIVKLKAHDLIRGFEPFGIECMSDAPRAGQRSFAQLKQDTSMHDEFLANLVELRCLETELDLTFEAVKSFSSSHRASSAAAAAAGGVGEAEEIMLDVELQKIGSASSVVLRASQNWELHQPGAVKRTQKIWGARPKIAPNSSDWVTNDFSRGYTTPPSHAVGDSSHTLCMELCERLPETVVLRRASHGSRPSSSMAWDAAKRRPADGAMILALPGQTPRIEVDADVGPMEAQCRTLERNFMQKLSGHYRHLAVDELQLPPSPTHVQGPAAAERYAAELVNAAARIRSRSKEYSQEYIREIRSALRLVGPTQPLAARVVEGAVKGLVVALDMSLSAGWQQAEELEARVDRLKEENLEATFMQESLHELQRENDQLKATLSSTELRYRDESVNLHKKIEDLKQEIQRLSPDQSDLEGVAGLMGEYNTLMQEMQEEGYRQTIILDNMKNFAEDVVGDAERTSTDPAERQRIQHGRVVELINGELVLRSHEVENQETQVTELDLYTMNPDAPVRLRTSRVRQLMTAFASENTPVVTLDELDGEIDKIYDLKIKTDEVADLAGLPRTELADFVVEFYLVDLRSVQLAQSKFCGILRCLQSADRNNLHVPLKVSLFQRFLEFCEYEESLPLTVLNVVLQAKRFATAQLLRQKPSDREREANSRSAAVAGRQGGKSRESASIEADPAASTSKEPQLGVAMAYEAAAKALPQHRIPAMRAFFAGLSSRAEVDPNAVLKVPIEKDLLVLLLLLHDRLQREGAQLLRDLIQRVESRITISTDEFREAIRDAKVQAIDDAVWLKKLADPASQGQLSTDYLLEFLGGGSPNRISSATIPESGFMAAVTEALSADYEDRMKHMQGLWQRQAQSANGSLGYADFESVVLSEEPTLPAPMLRALFLTSVELSRGCSQLNGDPCLAVGTLKTVEGGEYGGEVVTFPLFAKAALRCGLFMKEFASLDPNVAGKPVEAQGLQRLQQNMTTGRTGIGGIGKRGATPKSSPKR